MRQRQLPTILANARRRRLSTLGTTDAAYPTQALEEVSMNGTVISKPTESTRKHKCDPPVSNHYYKEPMLSEGTIWECECGKRWLQRLGRPVHEKAQVVQDRMAQPTQTMEEESMTDIVKARPPKVSKPKKNRKKRREYHRCDTPKNTGVYNSDYSRLPDGFSTGDLWRCKCGKIWEAGTDTYYYTWCGPWREVRGLLNKLSARKRFARGR
jgi:hypothetical protein